MDLANYIDFWQVSVAESEKLLLALGRRPTVSPAGWPTVFVLCHGISSVMAALLSSYVSTPETVSQEKHFLQFV
jgi:hypothetical protein